MDLFLLTPEAVHNFIGLTMVGAFALYLLSVPRKSEATGWLTLFMTALAFSLIGWGLEDVLYWPIVSGLAPNVQSVLQQIRSLTTLVVAFSVVQFAYALLENPFPRETRWMRRVTGIAGLGIAALVGYTNFSDVPLFLTDRLVISYFWTMGVLASVVLIRKRRRARRNGSRHARAFGVYLQVFGLFVLGVLVEAVPIVFGLPLTEFQLLAGRIFSMCFVLGLAIAYVNYSSEPTTMQVKLIGLTLVVVLAALMFVVLVVFPDGGGGDEEAIAPGTALRFEPDTEGGYLARESPTGYATDLGRDLGLDDDGNAAVGLPFGFPFAGRRWDSLYVSANGAVAFDGPITGAGLARYNPSLFYDGGPHVAPLYADFDPSSGGGVFARVDSSRAVVTWHDVPRFLARDTRNRVQLVLHRDGTVDMVYDRVEIPVRQANHGMRGLVPDPAFAERETKPWREVMPTTLAAGEALVEDFDFAYRLEADARMSRLSWLVVGVVLCILLVYPFFFRTSLVQPLERLLTGVKRVGAGDLDVQVPVGARDETGILTEHFNAMTERLRLYNEEMEVLVAERTAALEQSLAELRNTQAQLVQQEKMASLGQLTAGIAHEIKNPLNFVNNFAEVNEELIQELREALAGGEDVEALLDDLARNQEVVAQHGKRADAIVRSMMQHASGGSGQREAVDLNELVEEYVDLAYHGKRAQDADFHAEVVRDFGSAVGRVEVVPQDLGRVLLNLLSNAFDGVQGRDDARVTVATRRKDDRVEIRVSDNGSGIPDDVQAKIFEPFFTTKPAGSGTGLGLSLSHDIVTQGHGGTLAVESVEEEGATFVVTLPVAAAL